MGIQQSPSPNYRSGRDGRTILAIVDHITAGAFPGCLSWLSNVQAQASAHYLVTKAGEIFQLVQDEDTAWHAGAVSKPQWILYDGTNPNRYTIGIEHECLSGGELTEAQYQATLWLHRQLIAKWGIPVDANHIIGHYRIDSVNRPNCPGPNFPWKRLFTDLRGESDMPEGATACTIVVGEKTYPGYILGGHTYFGVGVPVADFMRSVTRTLEWHSDTLTLYIK